MTQINEYADELVITARSKKQNNKRIIKNPE
jgi:hypothetical protein